MKVEPVGGVDETRRTEKGERANAPLPSAETVAHPRADDPLREPDDRVELSQAAREFGRLAALAHGLPEIRHDRVEALRREITSGRYGIDPTALARAILELEDGIFN